MSKCGASTSLIGMIFDWCCC